MIKLANEAMKGIASVLYPTACDINTQGLFNPRISNDDTVNEVNSQPAGDRYNTVHGFIVMIQRVWNDNDQILPQVDANL